MSTHWAVKYVGVKRKFEGKSLDGLDCWGLLWLVYFNEFKIQLPIHSGVAQETLLGISRVAQKDADADWTESKPFDGVAVAMSFREQIHHVGIYTTVDGGKILHCGEKSVVVDTVKSLGVKGYRTIKFYRHRLWPL